MSLMAQMPNSLGRHGPVEKRDARFTGKILSGHLQHGEVMARAVRSELLDG